jgi:hypothetical protein
VKNLGRLLDTSFPKVLESAELGMALCSVLWDSSQVNVDALHGSPV